MRFFAGGHIAVTSDGNVMENPMIPWVETITITIGLICIGYFINPIDPFLLEENFPWMMFAPILIGSRYGFRHGLTSAVILLCGITIAWYLQVIPMSDFPTGFGIGILLVGIITGEVRETSNRKLKRINSENGYNKMRLNEFSREYHLIKASHARLEQKVVSSFCSLRTSVHSLRDQLTIPGLDKGLISESAGKRILKIFAEHGSVQAASIYRVTGSQRNHKLLMDTNFPLVAQIGSPHSLNPANSLLQEALKTGHTVSIKPDNETDVEGLLAMIPLADVCGRIWGVVAIYEMPYVEFHRGTIELLTVLGGHIGDLIRGGADTSDSKENSLTAFRLQLDRCLMDYHRCNLSSGMVMFSAIKRENVTSVLKHLQLQTRKLDQLQIFDADKKHSTICVLLPLTDKEGVAQYLERLDNIFYTQEGLAFAQLKIKVDSRTLDENQSTSQILDEINRTRNILDSGI